MWPYLGTLHLFQICAKNCINEITYISTYMMVSCNDVFNEPQKCFKGEFANARRGSVGTKMHFLKRHNNMLSSYQIRFTYSYMPHEDNSQ